MKNVLIVVGTRPNFIKVTQFKRVAEQDFPGVFDIKIVHTGQHYDDKMADVFFEQFELKPDYFLEIPPSSPNNQMAEVMLRLEPVVKEVKPDILLVTGDVNSTFAASLTANKMDIPLAHVESGLRSGDRDMPEEINRVLTDEISDLLFITEESGMRNLCGNGKTDDQLHFVGNTMIDTMVAFEDKIKASPILEKLGLERRRFVLMTMHRPATVDYRDELLKLISLIEEITKTDKLVFPIHPRTVNKLKAFELYYRLSQNSNVIMTEPMDYFSFQKLIANCKFILTDSGGIQEESTFRRVPCLTLRPNTERPSTIQIGTNTLVPFDLNEINRAICAIKEGRYKKGSIPPMWDGKATHRILQILKDKLVE
ncbi:non-hydrolyzing UDP-N-acetylglucosamine 2-epimerase [Fodinibius sp. Rm-B-1B1-1]|uniref:non-hydrolyzing UDP-N-acetylglucosamine 2-epimerase n=1 Tax=Fodinibius alkaliphilus TaxID=3140241 RepID=UPI003159F28D